MKIHVMYSCVSCGVIDRGIDVPVRERPEHDLKMWMTQTISWIAVDHHQLHPDCIAKELKDLKVPIEGTEWFGGPVIQ